MNSEKNPIPRPNGRAMGYLFWNLGKKGTARYQGCTVLNSGWLFIAITCGISLRIRKAIWHQRCLRKNVPLGITRVITGPNLQAPKVCKSLIIAALAAVVCYGDAIRNPGARFLAISLAADWGKAEARHQGKYIIHIINYTIHFM